MEMIIESVMEGDKEINRKIIKKRLILFSRKRRDRTQDNTHQLIKILKSNIQLEKQKD